MNPTIRYDLKPGEWRSDPPRIAYGSDRAGLAAAFAKDIADLPRPWTSGVLSEPPEVTLNGEALRYPVSEHAERLLAAADPAPFGRGDRTLIDPKVRSALQIPVGESLKVARLTGLRSEALAAIRREMGLADAKRIELVPQKLLLYRPGGHFADHVDTEKAPGMVASLTLDLPSAHEGGDVVVDFQDKRFADAPRESLRHAPQAGPAWQWAAWYADLNHRTEPVTKGLRAALTFGVRVLDGAMTTPELFDDGRNAHFANLMYELTYVEQHAAWAKRPQGGSPRQHSRKQVWPLAHRYTVPGLRAHLLKGRDRRLARLLATNGRLCLGWLHVRDVGFARTRDGAFFAPDLDDQDGCGLWAEEPPVRYPKRAPSKKRFDGMMAEYDLMPIARIKHQPTPQLHVDSVGRQSAWADGLVPVVGPELPFPVSVAIEDGEVLPDGALRHLAPEAARVYENTGNESASLELQYRHAVLLQWPTTRSALRALAECGGRAALLAGILADMADDQRRLSPADDPFADWPAALQADGGAPAPEMHQALAELVEEVGGGKWLRRSYVSHILPYDLDAAAADTVVRWLRAPKDDDEPARIERGLRAAARRECRGVPEVLRALCDAKRVRMAASVASERRWGLEDRVRPTRAAVLAAADDREHAADLADVEAYNRTLDTADGSGEAA